MTKMNGWKMAGAVLVLCAAMAIAASGQVFTTLANFDGTDGAWPGWSLVQGVDGSIYGAATNGGAGDCSFGCGTLFKATRQGVLTEIYTFCSLSGCADGAQPATPPLLGIGGNFYGTATDGGEFGYGTVFEVGRRGSLTTLYSFDSTDGGSPGSLLQVADGSLYGVTGYGGEDGRGTIFKLTEEGILTTLHSFCLQDCADGANPTALIQGTDGNFYGTAFGGPGGGCYIGCGTVFIMTPGGSVTTLHTFCGQSNCADGGNPTSLVQGSDGSLYGTTLRGGTGGGGTVFKIFPDGSFKTLHSFCDQNGCPEGSFSYGPLVQASDGNFYAAAAKGGANDWGTLFSITRTGTLRVLHSFCAQDNCADGNYPEGGLLQSTDGELYGTTLYGGTNQSGTIFSLDVGFGPFVKLQRYSGRIGQTGGILGQGFRGTTSVSLNGTPASFTVVSDTFLRAKVPAGATSGFVTVTTPSGTLKSDKPFQVIP